MGVDAFRTTVAALLVGMNGAGLVELLLPPNGARGTHAKPLCGLSAGHARGNRIYNAFAQID
ncbi:hypothetical protein D3C83_30060 [compost metagenome]